MDNGLELLKKVIKSNEENIERLATTGTFYEDILNIFGEFESSARALNYQIKNFDESLQKIPKKIEVQISEETFVRIESFEKKSQSLKYLFLGGLIFFIMTVIVMCLSFYFSKKWYAESIRTKQELRTQIFEEMRVEGKGFYKIKQINQLKMNTEIINKWIEKNPKEGNDFLIFKEGYEAKHK